MNFLTPKYAVLFLLVILLIIRVSYVYNWKKKAQNAFADIKMAKKLFEFSNLKQFIFSNFLILLVVLGIIIALMDPSTRGESKEVEVLGNDIVYCLDLSNSMDAEDVAPSRLEKAKQIIRYTMEKGPTDRYGLVIFANHGYNVIPITQGISAIDSYLDVISPASIVDQGTRFESAIESAIELFNENEQTAKNVIFLSDGEDFEDDIDKTIELANEHNLRLITVGIGTSKGSVIPETKNYQSNGLLLDEDDNPVITKLNDKSLKKMASETKGKFIYASSAEKTAMDIRMAVKANEKNGVQMQEIYIANHYFQWFVAFALIVIIIVSLTNIRSQFNI